MKGPALVVRSTRGSNPALNSISLLKQAGVTQNLIAIDRSSCRAPMELVAGLCRLIWVSPGFEPRADGG
jgi:hypothetical protein